MQFFGVKKWCGSNVFFDIKQKYVFWKICKVRKVFDCIAGAYYFQCQVSWGSKNEWGFLRETVLRNELSFLLVFVGFATFCWKIWKLKNIKALYACNNIFKNRILNMRFWFIYILVQISVLGTALGRFSQCFCCWLIMVAEIFTQPPPTIKTLPTVL